MEWAAAIKASAAFCAISLFLWGCAIVVPWLAIYHTIYLKVFTLTLVSVEATWVLYALYKIFEAKEKH